MTMATQTPTAPHCRLTQRMYEKPSRHTTMDATDTTMVNRTSLAARRALGSTKAAGHSRMPMPQWMTISRRESWSVSGERVYSCISSGSPKITSALTAPWAM